MRRQGPARNTFDQKTVNAVPDQPGVFAIFSSDSQHVATHIANANLRGAVRREATAHPEALEQNWFFVLMVERDADTRADLLAKWQESPENVLTGG